MCRWKALQRKRPGKVRGVRVDKKKVVKEKRGRKSKISLPKRKMSSGRV